MKTWIFTGLCDKRDLMLSLCALMTSAGQKVLLIDATLEHRYRYYSGNSDYRQTITEFAGFDLATGFEAFEHINTQLSHTDENCMHYDYILCDVEQTTFYNREQWISAEEHVWVSDYDRLTIDKSINWFEQWYQKMQAQDKATFVPSFHLTFIHTIDCSLESQYIRSHLDHLPIAWNTEIVTIPWTESDMALKLENEYAEKLRIRPLSRLFKKGLCELTGQISGMENKEIKKALKQAERKRA